MIFAGCLVRPHLFVLYVYIYFRIAENVVNHSGLKSSIVDLLTLKCLPLRASIAHHDAHHKYSNHAKSNLLSLLMTAGEHNPYGIPFRLAL